MKYLGLPLDAYYKATSIWNNIIEKMERWMVEKGFIYLREVD